MKKILPIVMLLFSIATFAQVGVNTTTPDPSSMLDITATDKGMLVPRMTAAQKTAIATPANGLLVYQTDAPAGFYYYNGTIWTQLGSTSEIQKFGNIVRNTSDSANDSFLIGSTSLDDIPGFNDDNRMFFSKTKAAFRAGGTDNNNWDNANMGIYSNGLGYNVKALGNFSTAMGDTTAASGYSSTAMGRLTISSGTYSTAMGNTTTASGASSTAMGNTTIASGASSTAVGVLTTASGDASTAMGRFTTSSGTYSTAMGHGTTSSGNYSTAMGRSTTASGINSIASGINSTASSYSETALGLNNTNAISPDIQNFIATDRLFTIGNGTNSANKSNAITVLKNGNTAIGNINPTEKLEVAGKTKTTNLQVTTATPAVVGQVLTATDTNGNMAWATPATGGWSLTGNTGTTLGANFLGTTDNVPLSLRVNNFRSGYIGNDTEYNSFFGYKAGVAVSTGTGNTLMGQQAGLALTTAGDNTAMGSDALFTNITGNSNTAIGSAALAYNTSSNNSALGDNALRNTSTGSNNSAIGSNAGSANVTGSNNTFIGENANPFLNNLSNATAIGSGTIVDTSNKVRLGNNNVSAVDLAGQLTYNAQSTTTSNTFPSNRGTNGQILTSDGAGLLSWATPATSGTTETASNGLTKTTNDIQLGGNLTANTTITQDTAESLTINNNGTANTIINLQSTGDFDIQDNGTTALFVRDDANVGIGTSSPLHKLDINPATSTTWTSNNWRGLLGFGDFGAIGWRNNFGGQQAGIAHTSNGTAAVNDDAMSFFSTSATLGTNLTASNYSMRIFDQNNQVGMNTTATTPDASAQLEIAATARGLLIPRVALTQTNSFAPIAVTPTNSLMVFNTATINDVTPGYYYWSTANTLWQRLLTSGTGWNPDGNSYGTIKSIGTNDNFDLPLETNAIERMRITTAGDVGIGTTTPVSKLAVNGAVTIGTTYASTTANAAPANGLRVEGQTVINKSNGQDARDVFSSHTSAAAFSNITGYSSVTALRAVAGYASANGIGVLGYSNRSGYGVVGLTQAGALSSFVQSGEGVLGQADGATGLSLIPIGVHGIIDETTAGISKATPVLGENNTPTPGLGFTGGAYSPRNTAVAGVYGNIGSRGFASTTNGYMFGVVGDAFFVSNSLPGASGGVLGVNSAGPGSCFGILGYNSLASANKYSVYGAVNNGSIAAGNTGSRMAAGATANEPNNHIGIGIYGGFMGGYVRGKQYGFVAKGDEFGMYVQGNTINKEPVVSLIDNNTNTKTKTYNTLSTSVDVTSRGGSSLLNGEVFVVFSDAFKNIVSDQDIINITITPTAETNGVFVSSVSKNGFYVKENGHGTSNATFNWLAIGTRKGYENGVVISDLILSKDFDENMSGVMNNDGTLKEGTPIYHDGKEVKFERIPDRFIKNAQKQMPGKQN